ncbi:MAG TPA: DNA repair exonuclease [Candidatus Nanopelagicaceae bacterium]|nr:DNA repair exonuclease [Candidatus Nanopelagicaceae bacterium]
MRLLHCSDVHLDTAFAGLGPAVARRRRAGVRRAFTRIVDLALEQRVDALTIGGDLYEDLRSQRDTAQFLQQQFSRLSCPVLIAPGNHDYWHPGSIYAREKWPENVTVFKTAEFTPVEVAGVRIFGAAHIQPKGTKDLLGQFKAAKDGPAIALFHGSERGQLPFQGEGKEDHAPFSEDEIVKAGFQYGLLGHFHTPRSTTRVIYPGNPEPLTFGEVGERGAALIDFANLPPAVEIRKVSTFTLTDIEVDVTGCLHSEAVLDRIGEVLSRDPDSGTRVRLVGEVASGVRLGPTELLERLRQDDVCVDLVIDARPALDLEALSLAPDARGQFVRALLARNDSDSDLVRQALLVGLDALRGEAPLL